MRVWLVIAIAFLLTIPQLTYQFFTASGPGDRALFAFLPFILPLLTTWTAR